MNKLVVFKKFTEDPEFKDEGTTYEDAIGVYFLTREDLKKTGYDTSEYDANEGFFRIHLRGGAIATYPMSKYHIVLA